MAKSNESKLEAEIERELRKMAEDWETEEFNRLDASVDFHKIAKVAIVVLLVLPLAIAAVAIVWRIAFGAVFG